MNTSRPKLVAALSVAVLLLTTLALPASGDTTDPFPVGPVVVGEDPFSDWGGGGNNAIVGHALGQDLVKASVRMPDADTVEFQIEVTFLPSAGDVSGWPEVSRYVWDMLVDGEFVELDGKFTNYSRGACDPTSGQCDPANGKLPRDPGSAPFLVRGNCFEDGNLTLCEELAVVEASFNAAARTITVPVPADLLGIQECSLIEGGSNIFGGSVSANPSAFFSTTAVPLDSMVVGSVFQVPTTDPDGCEDAAS